MGTSWTDSEDQILWLTAPTCVPVSLTYAVREGLSGFRRAPLAALAATSAMAVALVLVGVFVAVAATGSRLTTYLEGRIAKAEVYLRDDADSVVARVLTSRFGAMPGVVRVEYVSKTEATRAFTEAFGDEARMLDEAFLPASIRVTFTPEAGREDSLRRFAERTRRLAAVDDVVYDEGLLARVQHNLSLVRRVGGAVSLLVVLAAAFLVVNTVRLTIYARRLVIRTMKLVGATDAFVRRPFLVEGLVQGAIAGALAAAVLALLVGAAKAALPGDVVAGGLGLAWLPAAAFVFGVAFGGVATALAVGRFVRRVSLH